MAASLKRVPDGEDVWGRTAVKVMDVTLDSSYPLTNGYRINASDVGLKFFHGATVIGGNKASGAVKVAFDTASVAGELNTFGVLRVYNPTGGTAPATLAAPVITAGAVAVTSSAANGAIITGGIAVEVANATDLSSLIVRMEFHGKI